jgi:aminotransferase in exopolysaccharide biosynthesis
MPANDLPQQVVRALQRALGDAPAALHEPRFAGSEWAYLKDCLDSTFVSSVGAYVDRFEADLCRFAGARHAVAVVNGTAALHLALELAGVRAGDEVLMPSLTFVATANAVSYCRAVPHFVDSEVCSLGIDVVALREHLVANTERRAALCVNRRTGRVIRALVPMHTFGHPGDIDGLMALSHDFGLALVEDATESLGSRYHGRHTGTFGRLGTLSFNGNKTITTGGGGAILTDDAELARAAKHLSTTAKRPHRWRYEHDRIGYNYRMPNINAALGCAQLEQLEGFLASKRRLHARYQQVFCGVEGLSLMNEPAGCESNYWLHAMLLDEAFAPQRDAVLEATNQAGFGTRPVWAPMHTLAPYADCPRMALDTAESIERRLVNLPSSAGLAERQSHD